jgi:hypothetical protein
MMFVQPVGKEGAVVFPSRKAKTMATSPGCHPVGSDADVVPEVAPTNCSGMG